MGHIEEELKKLKSYLASNNDNDLSLSSIEEQLKLFIKGVKVSHLVKNCTIGEGILQLKVSEHADLLNEYKLAANTYKLMKFIPASGAASRMFHKLQSVLNRYQTFSFTDLKIISGSDQNYKGVLEFLINLPKFAFYEDLKTTLKVDDIAIQKLINESPAEILKAVLQDTGLGYSSKPKGAIKFHRYKDKYRTAFEEQIYESLNYIIDKESNVKIHFTISEEHTELFLNIIKELRLNETDFNIDVTYSYQKKSTDSIAVDLENKIIFDTTGNPVQRPGGHGALLENLNDLKADIVVIKNIDNLSVEDLSADTTLYKKLLIGFLAKIRKKVFHSLNQLENEILNEDEISEIILFAKSQLNIIQSEKFGELTLNQKRKNLFRQLNRPIRICGMVKNEGEPGGGPFWVKSDDGNSSLQIIEQAQINMNDENQKKIFLQSTYFNPVDLICSVKDFKGDNFNLRNFVDHQSGIITKKSKDGVELKALELPGLWNGGMADWITIFVEVPISTFNPVKEINDLLRKEHQN